MWLGELAGDLDVAGLVPALAGHVELQRERRLLAAVAGVEVPARAAGALERLDLADEDAVHQAAGVVGRLADRDGESRCARCWLFMLALRGSNTVSSMLMRSKRSSRASSSTESILFMTSTSGPA